MVATPRSCRRLVGDALRQMHQRREQAESRANFDDDSKEGETELLIAMLAQRAGRRETWKYVNTRALDVAVMFRLAEGLVGEKVDYAVEFDSGAISLGILAYATTPRDQLC